MKYTSVITRYHDIFYTVQADSEDEEEVFESSKGEVEGSCVDAREKLTKSIRLKWRKLKSHMERLDSQGSGPHGHHVTGKLYLSAKTTQSSLFET